MGYKLLGYVVWHGGGKWYLRRRLRALAPARGTVAAAGVVTVAIIALVLAAERERSLSCAGGSLARR